MNKIEPQVNSRKKKVNSRLGGNSVSLGKSKKYFACVWLISFQTGILATNILSTTVFINQFNL